MKVFFDHNMSPAIARALRGLFDRQHEVTWLAAKFRTDAKDIEWINELSREGCWVIISGDRRITKNRAEYAAFRNSRLVGFFLAPALCKAPVVKQTERILALWQSIETVAGTVEGGAVFELPMKTNLVRQLK